LLPSAVLTVTVNKWKVAAISSTDSHSPAIDLNSEDSKQLGWDQRASSEMQIGATASSCDFDIIYFILYNLLN
jgi:hypothetical protein